MEDLRDKLSKVKDEHAAELVDARAAANDERARMEAIFILGRIKQIGTDARSLFTALSAQEIRALEHFQTEKYFEILGYQTFVDFLEKSEYSPMSKHQYYERLKLLNTHGDEIYDLLTSVGISVRSQKLLGKGDLSIKGDRLCVGDKEIEISDAGLIKDVLSELFDEKRDLLAAAEKREDKIEKLEAQIHQGEKEFSQLQRNLDALREGNPYERRLGQAIHGMLELAEAIGQYLPDEQKEARGKNAMPTLWAVMQQVRKAYDVEFAFTDNTGPQASPPASLAQQVFAENNDVGDEGEQ